MSLLKFGQVALVRGGRLLFEQLDLTLDRGDALHLVGPNGIGKSSLIRLAAGLLRQSAGTIQRSPLALANDLTALDAELPLARSLVFWEPTSAATAMAAMGLSALADVPIRLLSTGQLKRASLARVAASGAPLWLLDEPLNGLDQDGLDRLDRLIETHRGGGGAVLAASHRPLRGQWSELRLGQ